MGRGGAVRVAVVALTAASLLALPTVDGIGDPPDAVVGRVAVVEQPGTAGWRVGAVQAGSALLLGIDAERYPRVQVRSRHDDAWTDWQDLAVVGDHAPDAWRTEADRVAAAAAASEPVWVGQADAVEVRVPEGGVLPPALDAVHSSGGDGLAWQPPTGDGAGAASALSVWPPMVPRTAWDPDGECRPRQNPDYARSVERVYVHHTAIFPHYEPEESDDLVRAMCVFHVERRGFDDIGYNFLIDHYGRIYQGRAGGILRAVVGAHASGFNTGSAGIAIIGNFDEHEVPAAALDSLDRLTAWLFEWHGIDPYAVTAHVSTGGDTTPHEAGEHVLLPTIVGHRQTATNTSCPGDRLFAHVQGPDPATHRVADRLRDLGVAVGTPSDPPEPQVVEATRAPRREVPETVVRVIESVVTAVRTLATGRVDQRILPGTDPALGR